MNVYTHIGFDDAEEELKWMEEFRKTSKNALHYTTNMCRTDNKVSYYYASDERKPGDGGMNHGRETDKNHRCTYKWR